MTEQIQGDNKAEGRSAQLLDEMNRIMVSIGATARCKKLPHESSVCEKLKGKVVTVVDDSLELLVNNVPDLVVATDGSANAIHYKNQSPEEIADQIIELRTEIVLLDYALKRTAFPYKVVVSGVDVMKALKQKGYKGKIVGYSSDGKFQEEFMNNGAICCIDKNAFEQGKEILKIAEVI